MPSRDVQPLSRGRYDGARFLSRSPFRCGRFVGLTAACFVCVALVVLALYRGWDRLSTTSVAMLLIAGYTIFGIWWRSWRCFGRLRQLYKDGLLSGIESGSPMDVALEVAVNATNDALFFSFGVMALLLIFIAALL